MISTIIIVIMKSEFFFYVPIVTRKLHNYTFMYFDRIVDSNSINTITIVLPVCNCICLPVHHIQSAVGSTAIENQMVPIWNSNFLMSASLYIKKKQVSVSGS